ncbi:MAG: hypothetical protein ACRENB_10095 [Gemmatimonadales bacterium]
MRARTLIVAAMMAGIWAVARSKPAPETGADDAQAAPESRALLLVGGADDSTAVVSDLEAGRETGLEIARPSPRKSAAPRLVRRTSESDGGTGTRSDPLESLVATVEVPAMSQTSGSVETMPIHLAGHALPTVPSLMPAGPGTGTGASTTGTGDRGPRVMIRGGRGGVDDDCDLHRAGGRRGGIAINSRMPALGGVVIHTRAPRAGGLPAGTRIR